MARRIKARKRAKQRVAKDDDILIASISTVGESGHTLVINKLPVQNRGGSLKDDTMTLHVRIFNAQAGLPVFKDGARIGIVISYDEERQDAVLRLYDQNHDIRKALAGFPKFAVSTRRDGGTSLHLPVSDGDGMHHMVISPNN